MPGSPFPTDLTFPPSDTLAPHMLAAAAFLTQYRCRNTREAYALDLRIYFAWCAASGVAPLAARRVHVQAFCLYLQETRGNGPHSVARRIGTLASFYKLCVIDGYIEHMPTLGVRLPTVHDDPQSKTWLTRYELANMLRAGQASCGSEWALISLMSTLAMRVTATCDVRIEHITSTDVGYRVLRTVGKGEKPSVKVLPVPVCLAVDTATAGRREGWLIRRRDGSQMTRRSADVVVKRLAADCGITKTVSPHVLRRSFVTLLLKTGADIHVVQDQVDHARISTTETYDALGVELHAQASHLMAAMLASAS